MNQWMSLVVIAIAVFTLSGCGGGSDGGFDPSNRLTQVDVDALKLGYIIDGYNKAGEDVTLEYCNNNYTYYTGPSSFYGHFTINADRINMFDDTPTGGSYRIDTLNYLLEIGREYSIYVQNDEIIVEQITEDLNCI